MELGLEGHVVLVTGAAGGIGRATAARLAAEGCRLVLLDRNPPDVGDLDPDRALAASVDVTDEAALTRTVEEAGHRFGGLDVVVGCAGISGPVGTVLDEVTPRQWHEVMDVNVTGSFLLLRAAAPLLRRSPAPSVVLVASDSALVAAPGMAPYCASKAAVLQLVRAASVDLAPIRVVAVCPSIVDTPMSRADLGIDPGVAGGFDDLPYPVQTTGEVAASIAFLCSPWARAVSGTALVSDFGYGARSGFPA
ncbi:SDR family NAD(P)-dependent oxidoreductase [Myceligenerans pegani]|uniref:SDR family oxidoreductase n=1 Tax=Myceligenerans pegani TaxID=2776917 RepID=A0ABR9MWS3_9MICO|nr:SDR family oxidoreductase [Myceligenerans sp. TRM 65318]MBE1875835.1 SDR family oxidoreductase [Myceligenerans sp. TRM 65318]MBE3018106.1 SDR family oxidoreductase [Myceligenerans sp. TRM 65318]